MNKFIIILSLFIIFSSCKKEDKTENTTITSNGFFIVCEGNYTWGNSSLYFYDENNNQIQQDIFYNANHTTLGDVAMDMKIINGKGFITVNNSGLIYVIDPTNAKHIATIGGLTSPRYILPINDSIAYVSDLYSPDITIINTKTYQKTGNVHIGNSTESMIKLQNKVFACSWSFNRKIYVINITQNTCKDSITVGLQPNSIVLDKSGFLWILCDGGYSGNPAGHENPSLWKINPQNNQIIQHFTFASNTYPANSLVINNQLDTLYYICHNVYKMSMNDSILPTEPFIYSENANFYSISTHPIKPWIIINDAKNYTSNGETTIYNTQGVRISKNTVGIIPRTICYYSKIN